MAGTSCRCRTVEGLCAQATMWDCCDSFGGGRRLLLGEPSANTPYPLARTFAPPPHFPPQHAGIPPSPNNHPPNHFFNHPTTTLQLRLNHPSWRIQERFRHNHPTSVILQLQPQNSAADSPRIKVLCSGSGGGGGEGRALRDRTLPRDWRIRRGNRGELRPWRRAFARGERCA